MLQRYTINNTMGMDTYVAFRIASMAGTYHRTWLTTRALLDSDSKVDTCLADDPPCTLVEPRRKPMIDEIDASRPAPLPDPRSFLAFRIINVQTGLPDVCAECKAADEFLLLKDNTYEVQLVVSSLAFLAPASVDRSLVRPIEVGPEDPKSSDGQRALLLAGIDEGELTHCRASNKPPFCSEHARYQLYQALIRVHVDIHHLDVAMHTATTLDVLDQRHELARREHRPAPDPDVSSRRIPLITWDYDLDPRELPPPAEE